MQNIDEVINEVLEVKIETIAARRKEFATILKNRLDKKRGIKKWIEMFKMIPEAIRFERKELHHD